MFELRRYIFSRTNNIICFLIVFYGWLQSSIELKNAREKAQRLEEIGEINVLMPFHRHLKELEMLGEPYMSVMRYEFKKLEKGLGFAVSPTFIIDQDITISHKLSKEIKLLYVEMGMHSTDHVLVEKGLRTFENPVLDNLVAVQKDKNAAKNIFISLSNPLAEINEEQFKKIKANIKPGNFGVLGSPKAGLVFHGKDVLKLLELEQSVKSSSMFLDFPKRLAKLAHVRHQWQASLRPFILPPVLLTLAQERFEKFYGRELEPNTKSMKISLTFQSDEIPPIYKFDMKQEFNGFLKYPIEFVEKYKCDQIGNKALYMLKVGDLS